MFEAMLNAIFVFNGKLGRVAFLGWMLAATLLVFTITFVFLMLGGVLAGFLSAYGSGPYILGTAMALTALVIGIWSALALQTKRIRDMGYRPLTWMLVVSIVMMIDQWALTPLTDVRFFPPFAQYTPLGGLTAAAYLILLMCWPTAMDADPQAEPAPQPQSAKRTVAPPPSPVLLANPTQAVGRIQFGLRN